VRIQDGAKDAHAHDSSVLTSLKAKLDRIPVGVKLFWEEFKEVRRLRAKKGDEERGSSNNPRWSRRELDLARRNKQDLLKVALTGIVFCIPGGGLAILGVLLLQPRYMTTHFWTDEMREEFILQDYLHKVRLQREVNIQHTSKDIFSAPHEIRLNAFRDSESSGYLQNLGLYHSCVNEPLYTVLSKLLDEDYVSDLTKRHIEGKFDEIISDDILLLSENAIKCLTRDELQRACLVRMICSPSLPNDELKSNLQSWLCSDKDSKLASFLLLCSKVSH